ncbi:isochorismatase family domain-containing protein [Ditylenchus destructor]|nr:isochorismatase family domain-containing protein [Ditylenchus destructor]
MLARYGYLNPLKTALLVCDMQSKNREAVDHFTQVAQNVRKLLDSVRLLGVKIVATEHQSDSDNAHSAEELNLYERDVPIIEKTKFTMFVPEVQKAIGNEIKTIVLCGIESQCSRSHQKSGFPDFPEGTTFSAPLGSEQVMAHFEALIELSILAKFQPEQSIAEQVVSHRKVGIPGFSRGHNFLCATRIRASNGSF